MSNDFEKVPDVVWKLFLEIMWADTGLWGGSPPGKPVELLSREDRLDAIQIAWGWDPPLMVGPSMTNITLHGLAFATWKERQLRSKKKLGRPTNEEKPGDIKIIAALCKWHKYEPGGSIKQFEPASLKDLEGLSGVSTKSISMFFKDRFGSKKGYDQVCVSRDIGFKLAQWQGELPAKFIDRMVDREIEDRRSREEE